MAASTQPGIPPFVVKAAAIASLGGILFGFDLGCISSALPQVAAAFNLTEREQELVVSFLYLGGGLGAAIGGSFCDLSGRKNAILATDVVFLVGSLILYFSQSLGIVLFGRIVVGFAVAVSAIADVSYLHEISPKTWRGSIVSVNEACISLGFLMAYILGYFVTMLDPFDGWRFIFGFSGLVAIVQFFGMLGMPESPIWLKVQGRAEEANEVMRTISNGSGFQCGSGFLNEDSDSNEENNDNERGKECASSGEILSSYTAINDSDPPIVHKERESTKNNWSVICVNYRQFCQEMSAHRRQATIAIYLAVAQQFCGHTNVLNYAPEIVQSIGLDRQSYILGVTVVIGTVKFVVTCFVIRYVETLGRRRLLLGGLSTIAFCLLLLSLTFAVLDYGEYESMGTASATISLCAMVGIAAGYAASFAPLTWLLVSEMFHSRVRGRALGASTIITYLSAALVSFFFLSAQSRLGPAFPFSVYFVFAIFAASFAALAVPDTGGKTPDEIELDLKQMRWWKWRDGRTSLWQQGGTESNPIVGIETISKRASSQLQLV